MSVKMVTYDLNRPGQNYQDLYPTIKALGNWWHCLESVWFVNTSLTSAQMRDRVRMVVDANDKVLVTPVGPDWATSGFNEDCNKWLRDNL